ncbi:hypothetical protein [Streptomyces subrutilus]|uniref:Uncharacterized protein n=1 Tax=Streptomyces subrutilus TaxID=36818 RepID=A0A5P2UYZ8_9ACTN|nr:hypothetical protein [Streptomyces subrutilus]QEU81967.1 hypothetical protein CP968_30115 [Streptomyces subrutilus]WSJ28577.1 hypothetical protein OG479_04260 [Streptomyces subrutilus]GGZ72217.1 hypothetical protein GCM10010371_35010 [Streptomyces subrutilus]
MTVPGQGFEPATGDGAEPGAGREAELRTAYEGLVQIRRMVNGPGGAGVPAPWEVRLPARAVALALEAAGLEPSAVDAEGRRTRTGYRVGEGPGPGRAVVTWLGPPGGGAAGEEQERLTACAAVLEGLGWVCLLYRGPRRRRFLEVEPPR